MHYALLLGFGATAINPYLAIETVIHLANSNKLEKDLDLYDYIKNYVKSINKGLKKIMSKMGISTLRSYRGSQIFEAIGLNHKFVSEYMNGVASRIEGIGLKEIAAEVKERYDRLESQTVSDHNLLDVGGQYSYRTKGENHLWSPAALTNLQEAVKQDDRELYRAYAKEINDQAKGFCTLRGLFEFKVNTPIPLDEVEPASEIMKRFVTGAMSLGSISPEVHETIAIAMNRIQGMSNSGEGGEDSARFKPLANGDSKCSAIKQVASGRFGVTIEYLSNCREIQIKIAQGAKPGEGGQLPGHKVNELIARVRNSTPGVTLISPPPHHDIYSIEDLAQLIYDLKNANPEARISVKLVSEVGVGTVAAGVSKGHADMVLIAGHDGGTGASPLTSVKHTGLPWELGLAETQQTLVLNKLRDRIRVQVDGQMKTGRDIIIGALLGGEEFGFGTTALVTMGCIMMRKCHSNTCPVGVATQDPELRKKFAGKPEYLINFLKFIAEEAREIMAQLGIAKFDNLVGRSDLLEMNKAITFWKAKNLDFSSVFARPTSAGPVRCTTVQNHGLDQAFDHQLLSIAEESIETGTAVESTLDICNLNRTAGTMLSGRVAKKYGMAGLSEDTIKFNLLGTAGQSFGAFLAHGITLSLKGEANDFVGKGLSGGKIMITPPDNASYLARKNVIAGNVALYGAVSGELYINGLAGERFCIRNSGALAVVEGVGDHCCEYMTGGKTIVLGQTGVNFGAGMSGGIAYVYDDKCVFNSHCNLAMVDLEVLTDPEDIAELKKNIEDHYRYTGSKKAKAILSDWENNIEQFVKVFPVEYKRVLGQMQKDDAEIEREPTQD
jgi:glutamate synthase domain-containing protein 2/glutamate synthase domain-containing protein 3